MRKLSLQMNKAMASLEKDPNRRGWFRLFRHMDNDHSGKVRVRVRDRANPNPNLNPNPNPNPN